MFSLGNIAVDDIGLFIGHLILDIFILILLLVSIFTFPNELLLMLLDKLNKQTRTKALPSINASIIRSSSKKVPWLGTYNACQLPTAFFCAMWFFPMGEYLLRFYQCIILVLFWVKIYFKIEHLFAEKILPAISCWKSVWAPLNRWGVRETPLGNY